MRGNVTKVVRKAGPTYRARVDLPPDRATGRRRELSKTFRTKKEAEAQVRDWLTEAARGVPIQVTTMTVEDFLHHWLRAYVDDNVRSTTRRSYEQQIRNHLIPTLAGSSSPSCSRSTSRPRWWRSGTASGGTAGLASWSQARCSGYTGCCARPLGDAISWGMIHVTRTLIAKSPAGAPRFNTPKTASGLRSVPIDEATVEALRSHSTAQKLARLAYGPAWAGLDMVFTAAGGNALSARNVVKTFRRITGAAMLPSIRFHDLRHSHVPRDPAAA